MKNKLIVLIAIFAMVMAASAILMNIQPTPAFTQADSQLEIAREAIHINGTASATATKISWGNKRSMHLWIQNTDATNDVQISFDDGTTFYSIQQTATEKFPISLGHIWVKASASTVTYQMLVLVK
jgi:hypothetical protein